MKSSIVVAASLVLVAVLFSNCNRLRDNHAVEKAVMDAQHHWEEALKQFDLNSMQSLLAEDYSQTDLRGKVQDRASWVDFFKSYVIAVHSGDAQFQISFEDTKVRVYRNVAVVTGEGTFKGQRKGVPVDNVIRFTNLWVERRGVWQLVSYQATPIESMKGQAERAKPHD
jgi:ketosteroid isomerase-like protein